MSLDAASSTHLAAERAHLRRARAELARMREHALGLQAQGGDALSGEQLARTLWLRARSLEDDPGTTLFFGRIDTDGTGTADDGEPHRWYIGRRHVSDDAGDPVVVDWRAAVAMPFYRATRAQPQGVALRRRFGVDGGEVTAYEDEHLTAPQPGDVPGTGRSAILQREIERPRVGPMRDIVATIQPEQDVLVRSDLASSICVQGAPGTGKTAVGLHRAAWLLYAHRERLSRSGVLVVGPSEAFLDHIGAVLPALGEVQVRHTTIDDLVAGPPVRVVDPLEVAWLKGQARMAAVLHRAVWSRVGRASEALVVPRGSRRWRVPASEVQAIVDELRTRGVRYDAARAMLPRRLAHAVLVRMERSGDSPDDRVQEAVARSRPVRAYAAALWPALEAGRVLSQLWSDPEVLAAAAEGLLDGAEQALLRRAAPPRSTGTGRWSTADLVLLDEVGDLLERTPSLGHVVLDEAQDLSPMQLRAVGRRASTGSLTVLGDIAQGTTPWATASWEESLRHLGRPEAHLEVLDRGFRVPAVVLAFAARLLPAMAPGLRAPVSVRESAGELRLLEVGDAVTGTVVAVREAAEREGSVGVVVPAGLLEPVARALTTAGTAYDLLGGPHGSEDERPRRVQLLPAALAKGLEFDHVVVTEPAAIAAAEPDERTGLRRLYVVLTRAVTSLTVVHAAPLPGPLAG